MLKHFLFDQLNWDDEIDHFMTSCHKLSYLLNLSHSLMYLLKLSEFLKTYSLQSLEILNSITVFKVFDWKLLKT